MGDLTNASVLEDAQDTLRYLITFLNDKKAQVRRAAAEAIVGLSSESGDFVKRCRSDAEFSKDVAHLLIRNVGAADSLVSANCLKALVNLSNIPEIGNAHKIFDGCSGRVGRAVGLGVNVACCSTVEGKLLELKAIPRVLSYLRDLWHESEASTRCSPAEGLMLIANLTRTVDGQRQFLGLSLSSGSVPQKERHSSLSELFLHHLVTKFLEPPAGSPKTDYPDEYLWVGHILVNISALEAGRRCLLSGKSDTERIAIVNALSSQVLRNATKTFCQERRSMIIKLFRHLVVDIANDSTDSPLLGECSLVISSLCCLVYPPRSSELRFLEGPSPLPQNGGLVAGLPPGVENLDADDGLEANPTDTFRLAVRGTINKSAKPRVVNSFIDEHAEGLTPFEEDRRDIFDILKCVAASRSGREELRRLGVYEVLRLWHLTEPCTDIV